MTTLKISEQNDRIVFEHKKTWLSEAIERWSVLMTLHHDNDSLIARSAKEDIRVLFFHIQELQNENEDLKLKLSEKGIPTE